MKQEIDFINEDNKEKELNSLYDDDIKYIEEINDDFYNKTGCKKKYLINTFGCQMNVHDSELLGGMLSTMGYEEAQSETEADIVLFNTCTVREHAENRAFGRISQLKALKSVKPDLIIGMCGCIVQQKDAISIIKKDYPYIDIVFGTHNIKEFPILLKQVIQNKKSVIDVWDGSKYIAEDLPIKRTNKISAFVNVMFGCNNFCSYCIVPYVRGREKSRKSEDIIREVKNLVDNGYKEINLIGQNVNSYGFGLEEKITFADLLKKVNDIPGIGRIRFTTSHPKDITDELIYAIRDLDNVCEHLHLPFQAGSNKILKAMNRHYTKERYLEIISKLRDNIPDISLTTDIIVGFPGETDEDYEATIDLVKRVKFDSAFTFIYSKRTGTPAAAMENQVSDEIKHKRIEKLVDLQNNITFEKNASLVGNRYEILVEDVSKKDPNKMTGRTRTNKLVHVKGDKTMIGKLFNVEITKAHGFTLEGEVICP